MECNRKNFYSCVITRMSHSNWAWAFSFNHLFFSTKWYCKKTSCSWINISHLFGSSLHNEPWQIDPKLACSFKLNLVCSCKFVTRFCISSLQRAMTDWSKLAYSFKLNLVCSCKFVTRFLYFFDSKSQVYHAYITPIEITPRDYFSSSFMFWNDGI